MLSEILEEAQGIKPMAQRGRGQTPGLAHKGGTPGGNPERLSPAPSPPGCPAVPGPMWGRDPSHFTHQSLEKAGPSRCERKSQQSSLETPVPALPFLLLLLFLLLESGGDLRDRCHTLTSSTEPGVPRHPAVMPPAGRLLPVPRSPSAPRWPLSAAPRGSRVRCPHRALPPTPTHSGHRGAEGLVVPLRGPHVFLGMGMEAPPGRGEGCG